MADLPDLSGGNLLSTLTLDVAWHRSFFIVSAQHSISRVNYTTTQINTASLEAMGIRSSLKGAFKMLQTAVESIQSGKPGISELSLKGGFIDDTTRQSSNSSKKYNSLSESPLTASSTLVIHICYASPFEEEDFYYELLPDQEVKETEILRGMIIELKSENSRLFDMYNQQQEEISSLRASVEAMSNGLSALSPTSVERVRSRNRGRSLSFDEGPLHRPDEWSISESSSTHSHTSSQEGACESCSKTARLKELHVCTKCWGVLLNADKSEKPSTNEKRRAAFEKRMAARRSSLKSGMSKSTGGERSSNIGEDTSTQPGSTKRRPKVTGGTRRTSLKKPVSKPSKYGWS